LGGYQSIGSLCQPGGRLFQSRQAVMDAVASSRFLSLPTAPQGSMYAFIGVDKRVLPRFDDQAFALELLETQHVLIAPGSSFNVPYSNYFRITTLPDETALAHAFHRIDAVLESQFSRGVKLETV
jgi:alanine-synthesizing transaminase